MDLSRGGACRGFHECYCIILESLDEIITNYPKAELIGILDQLLQQAAIVQICFLEEVLSAALLLILQSNHKENLRRSVKYTINLLEQIQENVRGLLTKKKSKGGGTNTKYLAILLSKCYWTLPKEKVRLHIFECLR